LTEKYKLKWVYGLSILFIAANALFLSFEFFWFVLFPFLLLLLFYYFFSVDKLVWIIVFFTPLSLNLRDTDFRIGVSLPTEPIMFGIMILFFIKLLQGNYLDKKIIKHPVTIAILINLVWMGITCITSEMPIVSIKFLLARLWFVITFYFVAVQLFKHYENIKKFLWLYIIPLTGIIIYTFINHSLYGFAEQPAHWVMTPFFNDHTSYGAIIALFFPLLIGFLYNKEFSFNLKFFIVVLLLIYTIGIIFSYTRAAWLSLGIALVVYLILLFKIKLRTLGLSLVLLLVLFFSFREQIFMKLEKNRQESSNNLTEHVQSISNISSDASNLERINRWESAFRMFKERPVFGWGPGTYMFQYAPFQFSYEKTIISTNAANGGNAHSEYIGPLAESGFLGTLTFITILICVIYTGVKLYKQVKKGEIKMLIITMLLGLITYFVHGMLNNFLDTDKISVPFWGFIAALVAIDIYHKSENERNLAISKNFAEKASE